MKILDRIPDRALVGLTLGFFALLGLDVAIIDAVPFIDEAALAAIATGLVGATLSRRKQRREERERQRVEAGGGE